MKIAFRVDASVAIGTGHVLRCLALAEELKARGGKPIFFCAELPEGLHVRLRDSGVDLMDIHQVPSSQEDEQEFINQCCKEGVHWAVVDGYQFNERYQLALKGAGIRCLFLDDYVHCQRYHADAILNHNIYANGEDYRQRGATGKLLMGTQYALLRSEFAHVPKPTTSRPNQAQRVLITLGGADPDNVTLKVLEWMNETSRESLDLEVVLGVANPHSKTIENFQSKHYVRVHHGVRNMVELMAKADMAISAGGGTCWELMRMGVPCLMLILADNQRLIAETLGAREMAVNLGWWADLKKEDFCHAFDHMVSSPTFRQNLSERGCKLVDGDGAKRVIDVLASEPITLRPATMQDDRLLWEWANDADVRANSFSPNFIPWESHCAWLQSKLASKETLIFIGENLLGEPVGQVRFDQKDNETAEVNLSVDNRMRNMQIGLQLLVQGCTYMLKQCLATRLIARVKSHNVASVRSFENAGFHLIKRESDGSVEFLTLEKRAPPETRVHDVTKDF